MTEGVREVGLDLNKVAEQVGGMVARLKAAGKERKEHLQRALGILCDESVDFDKLKKKIETSKTTWLVARLVEELAEHYKAPPLPSEFTVIATDGSHIDVDRHKSTRCYLINIGRVALHYGAEPDALLESHPHLCSEEEDLAIAPPEKGREQPIEGVLLGIKRSVEECRELAEMAAELPDNCPTLALLDGTLILWGLEAYPEFVAEELLEKGFLRALDDIM
ncbi:MAG: DNA double-strand break repair nuclease NurA, partial [Chloroflexi bacterium]|nr:DNA double-strand break repair nuclease NurA [Chloroflexota bacterium]